MTAAAEPIGGARVAFATILVEMAGELAAALEDAEAKRDAALAVIADLATTLPEVLDAAESDACATGDGIMAIDAVRAILAQAAS